MVTLNPGVAVAPNGLNHTQIVAIGHIEAAIAEAKERDEDFLSVALLYSRPAYSDLSIFQNTGVAGPPSTPVSDFRHALGAIYCPRGM